MAELLVIRHAQASFGADDYDKLSELGHRQSELVGQALRDAGWVPDRLVTGTLKRQQETLSSMGFAGRPDTHPGLNEYDFHDLLNVRFAGKVPDPVRSDRKTHFRTLRETILDWQAGGLEGARESWRMFVDRVDAARRYATKTDARRVLVISSGGPIGQLVAFSMGAPASQMIALNLQVKNTSLTRFFFSSSSFFLHEFNTTPHFATQERAQLLTYS
ncbi:histidine phosphatase family protein [Sedimentitalea arenosa]|uniref:Histidine phosphatase family protein n=1 Tax=Sedimentitalea arenosa TaxID=2798803 RepID=A0A8J7J7A0_9RHOB|nr:histidine phosphatase family protein [Arenibacterium arenosum]MBJ6371692.1 histidine phosphatase family protein [Arenibacterium arenosum]